MNMTINPHDNTPGRRLKDLRMSAGLSQSGLAKLSGVSVRTLQDYEQGKKRLAGAAAETVVRLAGCLGTTAEELLAK